MPLPPPLTAQMMHVPESPLELTAQKMQPFRNLATWQPATWLSAYRANDAKRWEEFANLTFTFDCTERAVGFYADQEHHCQIFHMCDEDGRRIPYICANDTSFNQQYRICDWDYNVNCAEAQNWYYLNELTYVTDPPKPRT